MAIVTWDGTLGGAHGKIGNSVLVRTQYGTVLRSKPLPPDSVRPAVEAQQQRFRQALAVYRTLTQAQNTDWAEFALSPLNRNPETGKPQGINAYNAFMGMAMRFLQASPEGDIPRTPPTFPFAGDTLTFTLSGETEELTITASAANSENTLTELLLRPVKFPTQAVSLSQFVSAGFVSFTPDDLTATLLLAPGWYRLATRYIQTTTGLVTYRQLHDAVQVTA